MAITNRNRTAIGWCEWCQKLMYTSRKAARSAAKAHGEHKGAYQCPDNELFWHIGSLPMDIRHGNISREDFYRDRAS